MAEFPKSEATEQGHNLLNSKVSSPHVKGSEAFETDERHKPHGGTEKWNHESQEGRVPDGFKMAPGKEEDLNQQKQEEQALEAEKLRQKEMIRQGDEQTKEFAKRLKETQEAREKQPKTPEEQLERERAEREKAQEDTRKHEEKQAKEAGVQKTSAVLHGSATRETMKEEELMHLKPDTTPGQDKGQDKEQQR